MSTTALQQVLARIDDAATRAGHAVRLLAVSKQQPAEAVAALAAAGQRAFGENYVQEALAKQDALTGAGPALEWHLVGHLQSNKAREAAERFHWVQGVDRNKLVEALARHRPASGPPLNVLLQVNIDGEAGKQGCRPEDVPALAEAVEARPSLCLRGLMAIPAPARDMAVRARAFEAMRALFEQHAQGRARFDTLSMGMSADYELAIAHGATLVRLGTALFGARVG